METVVSRDGTRIAFARSGEGPPLILVHGTTADHTRWAKILPALERSFTVFAMDRRGRGRSGDADEYSLEREYDDIAAVAAEAGEEINLLGHSFGALCAMEAALGIDHLNRLVLYEPAFPVGDKPLYPAGLADRLQAVFETGDRDALLAVFFKEIVGVPDEQLDQLRADPSWHARIAAAHTVLREMADGEYRFDAKRFRNMSAPTLLLIGENSPEELTAPARALDDALPDSRVEVLAGQGHIAMTTAPELFTNTVIRFLSE